MAVRDHGIEVLKKAGRERTPGDKSDYDIQVVDDTNATAQAALLEEVQDFHADAVDESNETQNLLQEEFDETQLKQDELLAEVEDFHADMNIQADETQVAIADLEATVQAESDFTQDLIGLKTEAAPATDTASSGLNGRLQRIAQRLTTYISDFGIYFTEFTTYASNFLTLTGSVNETAPASDTANSGLNGRLQRIAQRLTSILTQLITFVMVRNEGVQALIDTTNRTALAVTTSAAIDTLHYGTAIVSIFSSHACSFTVEWSHTGVGNWRPDVDTYSVSAGVLKGNTYGPKRRFMRIIDTMGAVTSTTFELTVDLKSGHTKPSSHKADEVFNLSTDLEGTKALICGVNPAGTGIVNVKVSNGGSAKVGLAEISDIAGANTSPNSIPTVDILAGTGVEGGFTVTNAAVQVMAGGSPLTNRKNVTATNNSSVTWYWGYTTGVTTSNGNIWHSGQCLSWDRGPSSPVYAIAATAGPFNGRAAESA